MQQSIARTQSNTSKPSDDTVAQNVMNELHRLRDELERTAHDLRMKSKGASAEIQDTGRMLEREVKRFSAKVSVAADETRNDLEEVGEDLRIRFQKLANQIAFPSN